MPTSAQSGAIIGLTVSGYKSIRDEQSIEIAPLTILAGANSSGKSSMIQPLLLLKQTLEATYDPGPLLLDGPNVRFSHASQLFFSGKGRHGKSIRVAFPGDEDEIGLTFEKGEKQGITLAKLDYRKGKARITLNPNMSSDEIRVAVADFIQATLSGTAESGPFYQGQWQIVRNRCYLEARSEFSSFKFTAGDIQSVIHLPGLRGNPLRTY
ncbi:MAG TPA: hypothetical protein VMT34_00875, partial [Aggregatilineales bacterium]|nr:hypothetical protein [Aggregatilineales bacterium]